VLGSRWISVFALRVVSGSVEGIGNPYVVFQQEPRSPAMAGEHRILVMTPWPIPREFAVEAFSRTPHDVHFH
jgi:hypothetical protein